MTSTRIATRTTKGERTPPAAPLVVPAFAPHQVASRPVGATVGARVAVGAGDGPVGWGVGNVGNAQAQLEHAHGAPSQTPFTSHPTQSMGVHVPPPRSSQDAAQSIVGAGSWRVE